MLNGCASKPSPSLYFLDQGAGGAAEPSYQQRIGLAEVVLPAYALKEKIANLTDRHRLTHDDNHRWAEPPETAVSVATARALGARLERAVLLQPYPRSLAPTLKVKVVFDRFLRGQNGQADVSGHYFLITGDDDEVVTIGHFQYSVPAGTPDYPGYMAAVLKVIELISDQIATDVESYI